MNLKTPTVTVQNTDSSHWLVTVEGALDGMETVEFTVAVPRSNASVVEVVKQATARAIELLQDYHSNQ